MFDHIVEPIQSFSNNQNNFSNLATFGENLPQENQSNNQMSSRNFDWDSEQITQILSNRNSEVISAEESEAIVITGVNPDLVLTGINTPRNLQPGTSLDLSYTLRNQGNANAEYFSTEFFLSTDNRLSSNDRSIGTDFTFLARASETINESVSLYLNSDLQASNYYIIAKIDTYNYIRESNENNNIFVSSPVGVVLPDLAVSSFRAPKTISTDGDFNISYTLRNQGEGKADLVNTEFYLSRDTSLSDDDLRINSDFIWSLGAGQSSTKSVSLSLNGDFGAGTYYLFYKTDSSEFIPESNENNNTGYTTVQLVQPDLAVGGFTGPTNGKIGQDITVNYTLRNLGKVKVPAWHNTNIYLSTDRNLSSNDSLLESDYIWTELGPRASLSRSVTVNLDAPNAGNYYLILQADGNQDIAESRENNNQANAVINIQIDYATHGYGLVNAAAAVAKALGQNTFADVPDLGGNDWGVDLVKAPEVWAKGYTGQGVVVAVLDTGVDRNHSDLRSNIWTNTREIAGDGIDNDRNGYVDDFYGWNTVNNNNNTLDVQSHGTHVAGTIAGVRNNFGVTGVAYNAKIMPVKVLNDEGSGTWTSVANGIRYAVDNGANVINMSLGGPQGNQQLEDAVKYAASRGVIVVMAAGNDGGSAPGYPGRYATHSGIVVGAVDNQNRLADFSNRAGAEPITYVTAPGVGVYSTVPNNGYDSYNGTSMASPHVAGVVALMLSARRNISDTEMRSIITSTAQFGSASGNQSNSFKGMVDADLDHQSFRSPIGIYEQEKEVLPSLKSSQLPSLEETKSQKTVETTTEIKPWFASYKPEVEIDQLLGLELLQNSELDMIDG